MRQYAIMGYGLHGPTESNARFTFSNGTDLVLAPCRNGPELTGCLKAALFYDKKGWLVTAMSDLAEGNEHKHGHAYLWSRPRRRSGLCRVVDLDLLARYWALAADKGAELSGRHAAGRMPEEEWRSTYWEVWMISTIGQGVRESLERKNLPIMSDLPPTLETHLYISSPEL